MVDLAKKLHGQSQPTVDYCKTSTSYKYCDEKTDDYVYGDKYKYCEGQQLTDDYDYWWLGPQ